MKRVFLLYPNYNNILIVDEIYCLYCYILLGSSQNMLRRARIFFSADIYPKNIYCFCVTNIVFLCNNKPYINDQINFYVIIACIFLFMAMIQFVCQFCLYIFVLTKKFIRSVLLYHRYNIIFNKDPIYFYYSYTNKKTYIVSV